MLFCFPASALSEVAFPGPPPGQARFAGTEPLHDNQMDTATPPMILSQPGSLARYLGGRAVFNLQATANPPPFYQWLIDGEPIPGATSYSLELTNLTLASVGAYSVIVTNVAGSVTSAPAYLTVRTPGAYAAAVLSSQPAALYCFDETNGPSVFDALGNHDGFAYGSVLFGVPGVPTHETGSAAHFNASARTQVDVPYAPALNGDSFTVECWARVTGGSNTWRSVVTSREGNPTAGYVLYADGDNKWNLFTGNGTLGWRVAKGPSVVHGKWTHLAATFDGGIASLYVDGNLAGTATNAAFQPNSSYPLRIGSGATEGYGAYPFIGDIDEVAIYSYALSSAEVWEHFAAEPPGPPIITMHPVTISRYPGATAAFSVNASGATEFEWLFNGSALPGETNSSITLSNLASASAGSYYAVAGNAIGSVTSAPASLVIFDPGAYASAVLADSPAGYWSLDESSGPVVLDAWGGQNGTATANVQFLVAGALTNETGNAARFNATGAKIDVPYAAGLNHTSFTVECWARVTGGSNTWRSPLTSRDDPPTAGYMFYASADNRWSFFTGKETNSWQVVYGPAIKMNEWTHLVGTYDGARASFYVDGQLAATANTAFFPNSQRPLRIGAGATDLSHGFPFIGDVDEVAVYAHPLSATRVLFHYISGKHGEISPPVITTNPASLSRYHGGGATFSVAANGSDPLSYRWFHNEVQLSGQTSTNLVLNNLAYGSAGSYFAVVSNLSGSITSSPAALVVLTPTPYVTGTVSNRPVAYWRLGESNGPDVFDSSGNHHGTAYGNVSFLTPGALTNDPNTAVSFDGTAGARIEVPYSAALNTTSFTAECWARVTGGSNTWRSPLTSRDDSPTAGYAFYVSADNRWVFMVGNGATNSWRHTYGPAAVPGKWTHLAGTFDGTNASFYVDAQLAGKVLVSFVPNSRRPMRIGAGATEGVPAYPFIGDVDEVAFYNRALSASAIEQHHALSPYGFPVLPIITNPPVSITRFLWGTAEFTVGATGTEPLSYTWNWNSNSIWWATGPTLTLTSIPYDYAGEISVIVANAAGAITSAPVFLTVQTPGPYQASFQTNTPVAYWRLNETAGPLVTDICGGYDGTAASTVQFVLPGALSGDPGPAARFNGVYGTQIDVPYAPALNPPVFTVFCWARVTGGSNTWRSPLASRDDAPPSGYLFYASATNGWEFWTGPGSGNWNALRGPAVVPGQWTFLAGTVDGTKQRFYVDGQLVASRTAGFKTNSSMPLRIGAGATESPSGYGFVGDVDEVAVYNRALTAVQIQQQFAAASVPMTLTWDREGSNIRLVWPIGPLESSESPAGPWEIISNATSPWTVSPTNAGEFFRIRLR